jgi:hypothetical protein
MKVKLLSTILLFSCHFGFSQSEKLINGKVLQDIFPVEKVEVANFSSKKTTITNTAGEFSMLVKAGDELIFISKDHDIKKIALDQKTIDKNNLIISLILKPEQLEEVVVTKMPSIKLSTDKAYEQGKLDQYALEKAAAAPKVQGVNMGTIENGMDIMRIGGMIIDLFRKEKEPAIKTVPEIEFKTLASTTCDKKFYVEKLRIKPNEIALFIEFCDADPNSKKLSKNTNVLAVMDFLFAKNMEFKKLPTIEKR